MAARSVSPGGALLRSSRVFAIPPALPRPAQPITGRAVFDSDSATLPHPIRLSIATPQASLARGDWGLKRQLPLRSTTKSSTPLMRVSAIDTFERITEYASAADHTINLQKWEEMGIPLTVPVVLDKKLSAGYSTDRRRSVFEEDMDYTTDPENNASGDRDIRWRFKGPFLANQSEGGFVEYLSKEVRNRRQDFQKYLRVACAAELTARARRAATEEMPAAKSAEDVTQEEFTVYVKELRHNRKMLYKHIRDFLDLAPVAPPGAAEFEKAFSNMLQGASSSVSDFSLDEYAQTLSPYAKSGPPPTHPSAGLSYSRAIPTANHPLFGPQKHATVMPARVIKPKGAFATHSTPALGVGGFVVDIPKSMAGTWDRGRSGRTNPASIIPGLQEIEPGKAGGSKTYLHGTYADVNNKGQVVLVVEHGDPEAIAVREGTTDQIPKPQLRPFSSPGPGSVTRSTGYARSSASRYGLGEGNTKSIWASPTQSGTDSQADALKGLSHLLETLK